VQSIQIDPFSTLDAGSHTLTLTNASATANPFNSKPLSNSTNFNAGTGTVKLEPTGGDHVEISSDCSNTAVVYNNLIMGTITTPKTVYLGHSSCPSKLTVNRKFINGSSASAKVSFVKGDASSDVTNAVTSYYCASNGGISNIDCQAGAPGYGSSPAIGSTLNISGAVGTNPTTTLTVSETGNINLGVGFIQVTGTDAAKFSFTPVLFNTSPQFGILDGHQPQDVGIVCDGSVVGTFTAQLEIVHNATGSPATYPLSCTIGGGGGGGTPISASVESDLAFALTFLGIVLFAAFKMRKNKA